MLRLLAACLTLLVFTNKADAQSVAIKTASLVLFDTTRHRQIPVMLYEANTTSGRAANPKLAIIGHGYGGHNTDYSFIASTLVARGYVVASIQHELPDDEPIATTGNLRETRRPNWERGVANIRFVLQTLLRRHPTLTSGQVLLVGHSNGGDISMLFAQMYPAQVAGVISLDSRRFPFPRTKRPRILSIRSSDQVADQGVLPAPAEQQQLNMTIVQLPIAHNDMWDGATDQQKRAMAEAITRFLAL